MDKEKAKEKIGNLVKEFLEYSKEEINKKSENQIKSEFIDPLFECLGWDMRKDAEREERILKGRADLSKLGDDNLKEVHGRMKGLGIDTKDIETYVPSLAGKAAAEEARKKGLTTTQQAAAATQATEKAINSQSADKMGSYAKNTAEFQDSNNQTIMVFP